jgi:nitronate monooxygenase
MNAITPEVDSALAAAELRALALDSNLKLLKLQGKELLPIVQGGMGVGISAGGLAGTVASYGAVGTISSVDLRRLHADLYDATKDLPHDPEGHKRINEVNQIALTREVQRARKVSGGRGVIGVNIMKALTAYADYVRTSLEAGVDFVVVGAGLPLDLPELATDFPKTALIPILSDARGVQLVVRKWEKRGRLPDAVVIEHPRLAAGHLGAAKIDDLNDPRFDFENVIPEVLEFFKSAGYEKEIPLIPAGAISTYSRLQELQGIGAAAAQMGTPFAVSREGDAHPNFKQVLAGAKPEDIVEFQSTAGLPARGVRTHWLDKYVRVESKLRAVAHEKPCHMNFDCLAKCGFRDGNAGMGQFCIDLQLGHALSGETDKGLFFRGAGTLPFGDQIRSVRDLLTFMVSGRMPLDMAAA